MSKHEMMISLKRIYEEPAASDGTRVLVERLWPRGFTKERAQVDMWPKEITPSRELHEWYSYDPEKYIEFRRRYKAELASEAAQATLTKLRDLTKQRSITLVFAASDVQHSNAVVLRDVLLRNE